MLLIALRAPVLATNTLVLTPGPGGPAVVVDPGAGVAPQVHRVLAQNGLTVAAVLLTHGHPDHTWDCAAVAGDAPVYVGEDDAERLADPVAHLGSPLGPMFTGLTNEPWRPVTRLEEVRGGELELVPGLTARALLAPGHTPGSTVWWLEGVATLTGPAFTEARLTGHEGSLLLTGDVLFAGSVGRTDLPGGDQERMRATLRELAGSVPADAVLVPGHGPATTMAREHATNLYLADAMR